MHKTKYRYVKERQGLLKRYKNRRIVRTTSFFLVALGLALVFYVVYPILNYQLLYAPILGQGTVIAPIPQLQLVEQGGGVKQVYAASDDSTSASSWFPTGNPSSTMQKEYTLSIPKLHIDNAKVSIGSDDLSKSIVHYGGSSLPGQYGNAVVFGHSVLPQFFNPKNYMTIFSTLHTLKEGDTILVNFDSVVYKYTVFDIKVVDPDNISVLEQQFDDSYFTIITCTPPGTLWKRLVVKSRLQKI